MSTPRPLSVIFDLDGTLVDSEPNYYEAGRRLLARHAVPDFTWEEHARFVGIGTRETLEALREKYGITAGVGELLAEYNQRYLELARASTEVYPEMLKLVERLHTEGVPMAVASGSSRAAIESVLAGTGLDAYLSEAAGAVVVSAEEVAHGKPAPDIFLRAAALLAAEPGYCSVFEDAAPGVTAAFAAGMRCAAIPYVEGSESDPAFGTADLLFRGGHADFTAQAAYVWLGL